MAYLKQRLATNKGSYVSLNAVGSERGHVISAAGKLGHNHGIPVNCLHHACSNISLYVVRCEDDAANHTKSKGLWQRWNN
eukprot:scaffold244774_cov37-Prasinocladus_malaysianus.AAC.2